ncbi:hypothetical protein GJ688_13040 [Heliobacillus mobilis]|uniref:Copper amine oxidase-like N-terminal domain-containing protein n=1 Tax=Heliobacterium mobile TaxID=28064 RepID=A0A6I3SLY1_HELMO|nr:copper amine oxidase N-terminal domain-containing protein [Heliobacterium mobile]MTV49899.1 hypothetical protein [Heliobacterium mobile]
MKTSNPRSKAKNWILLSAALPLLSFLPVSPCEASATYSVVSASPVQANSYFDRKIRIEVPSGALESGETDEVQLRFNSGVSVQSITYRIPKTVESAPNMFEAGTGELRGGGNEFTLTVTGSGGSGDGVIYLDLNGITAKSSVHDVRVSFEAASGSIFQPERASLTSDQMADYDYTVRTGAQASSTDANAISIDVEESEVGSLKSRNAVTLELPYPLVWDLAKAKLDVVRGDLQLSAPSLSADRRTLSISVERPSHQVSTFLLTGLSVSDPTGEKTQPYDYFVKTGGSSRSGADQFQARFIPAPKKPQVESPEKVAVFTVNDRMCMINGKEASLDAAPFISQDRLYLPIRAVAEAIQIKPEDIAWEANEGEVRVNLRKDGHRLSLTTGNAQLEDSRKGTMLMDVVPVISPENRVFLPARWIVEPFGYTMEWDALAQKASILRPHLGN